MFINGRGKVGINKQKTQNHLLIIHETVDDVFEKLEENNTTNEKKRLIVFDNLMKDKEANKRLSPIVT